MDIVINNKLLAGSVNEVKIKEAIIINCVNSNQPLL
jgi:hypothetical protein